MKILIYISEDVFFFYLIFSRKFPPSGIIEGSNTAVLILCVFLTQPYGQEERSHCLVSADDAMSDDETLGRFDLHLSERVPSAPSSHTTQPVSLPVITSL